MLKLEYLSIIIPTRKVFTKDFNNHLGSRQKLVLMTLHLLSPKNLSVRATTIYKYHADTDMRSVYSLLQALVSRGYLHKRKGGRIGKIVQSDWYSLTSKGLEIVRLMEEQYNKREAKINAALMKKVD